MTITSPPDVAFGIQSTPFLVPLSLTSPLGTERGLRVRKDMTDQYVRELPELEAFRQRCCLTFLHRVNLHTLDGRLPFQNHIYVGRCQRYCEQEEEGRECEEHDFLWIDIAVKVVRRLDDVGQLCGEGVGSEHYGSLTEVHEELCDCQISEMIEIERANFVISSTHTLTYPRAMVIVFQNTLAQ